MSSLRRPKTLCLFTASVLVDIVVIRMKKESYVGFYEPSSKHRGLGIKNVS